MRRWLLFLWWTWSPPLRIRVLRRLMVEGVVFGADDPYGLARMLEHLYQQLTVDERAYADLRWPFLGGDILASIPRLRAKVLAQLRGVRS